MYTIIQSETGNFEGMLMRARLGITPAAEQQTRMSAGEIEDAIIACLNMLIDDNDVWVEHKVTAGLICSRNQQTGEVIYVTVTTLYQRFMMEVVAVLCVESEGELLNQLAMWEFQGKYAWLQPDGKVEVTGLRQ